MNAIVNAMLLCVVVGCIANNTKGIWGCLSGAVAFFVALWLMQRITP